jgi:tRNA(Ile)-lysidine synthase
MRDHVIFSPRVLADVLERLPVPARYLVAFSGGPDSHVLLHGLVDRRSAQHTSPVLAVHVDHGLHPDSRCWLVHCQRVCDGLGVELIGCVVDARPGSGESPEAAARRARYHALAGQMIAGDMVLTAHHADDQAETVLLHLFRGGGPRGLAAMPELSTFGPGWLARPLLEFTRQQLEDYAAIHGLRSLEDPSNRDERYDRNYLRRQVVPVIGQRWPTITKTLARAARQQARAADLLDALAAIDLAAVGPPHAEHLSVAGLRALDEPRRANLIRYWLRRQGLPVPTDGQMRRLLTDVLYARADAEPMVHWAGGEMRRYRDGLYAMAPLAPPRPGLDLSWDGLAPLELPDGNGRLVPVRGPGGLDPTRCAQEGLRVRYRDGSEICRIAPGGRSRSLKKLLPEVGLPPWVRRRLPLLLCASRLVAVPGLWVCQDFAVGPERQGLQVFWEGAPVGYRRP